MKKPQHPLALTEEILFQTKSTGFGGRIFRILKPHHGFAAWVTAESVKLQSLRGVLVIPLRELEAVDVAQGLWWSRVWLRGVLGVRAVSGISPAAAAALAEAVERERRNWWRSALAGQTEQLQEVCKRLDELVDPPRFVTKQAFAELTLRARSAAGELTGPWPKALMDTPETRMLLNVLEFLRMPHEARTEANRTYISNELVRSRELFDRIERRPLTDEQRRAVVIDERRNLVVAAAGSGKTSAIVAKTGWLIKRALRKPTELLLLVFARNAREEMEDRIRERLGAEIGGKVKVSTFHALGLEIIGQAEGRRPALANVAGEPNALTKLVKNIIAELLTDHEVSARLIEWFEHQFAPYKSEHQCASWGEYYYYIRKFDIRTLKGETVKSFEECEIANFLYLHGVNYAYECRYEHDTATSEKRQYRPDFYLPEYDIYIEHFGINAAGNPAPFVDRAQYLAGMKWKKDLHAKHRTVLIETFSHEHADGKLLSNLKKKLERHGVALSPMPTEEAFATFEKQGRIEPFIGLVGTFLQHFKGGGQTLEEVAERADSMRAQAFLAVFRPIYERYQAALDEAAEIDFHDMINRATDLVESGRFESSFGYILVDEFQDISPSRAGLLKALLKNRPGSQLFAVGDDWQAIYRFAGSDIAVMREFGAHFGHFERIDLQTTFRCNDRIAAVATGFVLKNNAQIRKQVRAVSKADGPAVFIGLPGEQGLDLLSEALNRIDADAAKHDGKSEVLVLGRYRHVKPNHMTELARQYGRLRFSWNTVHGSKGLEADYALVLDMCAGKYGFPSEIADDPLLDLVLSKPESYPNAEERRLLYVAITRARRQVYLLAAKGPPSTFVEELIKNRFDVSLFGRAPEQDVPCPHCKEGRLVRRENSRNGSVFYSCSYFPLCDHKSDACPRCGRGLLVKADGVYLCRDCNASVEACPKCGGHLAKKMGKYGRFIGCSNWPDCEYTINLR